MSERVVDVKQDMPEPWASAAIAAGFTRSDGQANLTALARAAGTNIETTRRLVTGKGRSGEDVIRRVAEALKVSVTLASDWANQPRPVAEPYIPPDEVHRLNTRQREALTMVIKAMVTADPVRKVKSAMDERLDEIAEAEDSPPPPVTRRRRGKG